MADRTYVGTGHRPSPRLRTERGRGDVFRQPMAIQLTRQPARTGFTVPFTESASLLKGARRAPCRLRIAKEATMSFSVFDRGEGRFDLMRGDAEIGWIADRAVGFGGFENAAAAHRARSRRPSRRT